MFLDVAVSSLLCKFSLHSVMDQVTLILVLCTIISNFATLGSPCTDCLFLTPYIKNGNASEARNLSIVNSTEFFGLQSHSGFVTVQEKYNNNLFFWFFPAETPLSETPWVIWLQGGPGVSSMLGLFDGIGPLSIASGKLTQKKLTWASNYSLLFVDNPVGAGYSFTDDEQGYTHNEDDVGAQLLELVRQFLEMFPELRRAPLFIAGQSYGGKYVPALGIQIHNYNKKEHNPINLRGISIGNGLIDMRLQMHYSELCRNLGLLDGLELDTLASLEKDVIYFIEHNRLADAANRFNQTIEYIKKKSGVNIYNFVKDPSAKAPDFEDYIKSPRIRQLIHVGNASFDYNNQHVYYMMLPDIANTTKPFVEELLEHYGVMLYSGQLDIILPYSLSKHLYAALQWSKRDEYLQAPRRRLRRYPDETVVGYKKKGGNFVEILLRGAGHSVPSDKPDVTKFIMDTFIKEFK